MGHLIITTLILLIVIKLSNSVLRSSDPNALCEHSFSILVSERVPYEETYKNRFMGVFHRTKTRINYRTEYHTVWHKDKKCCPGYFEVDLNCKPVCQDSCQNGFCYKPNECRCNSSYTKDKNNSNRCLPVCENECIQGTCTKPNICVCNSGYSMLPDGFTCTPTCNFCPENSICTAPNICTCVSNYKMETTNNGSKEICSPICDRPCVNSDCVAPDVCKCRQGYEDLDGDAFNCTPKCSSPCDFGTCTAPEECTCSHGYSRSLNDSSCQPICNRDCINGVCIAPNVCSCSEGYGYMDDSEPICEPICEPACENGRCTAPQICTCDDGYKMNNESKCEPICTQICYNGECTAPEYCNCFNGFEKSDNLTNLCEPVCNTTCENGRCTAPEVCTCNEGYLMNNESNCEPICTKSCYNGECTAPEYCTCFNGYDKTDNFTNLCEPVCNSTCENGHCTAPEECTCNEGFEKEFDECVPECECIHGSCSGKNRFCVCEDGYELLGVENSTTCVPVCDQDCVNAECISPHVCKCHDNYVMNNGTGNNSTCVSACGVECVHGLCHPEEKACSCFYGWTGRSCEVALKCAALFDESKINGKIFTSYGNETENTTYMESQWKGPICEEDCFPIDANRTDCFNNSIMSLNSTAVVCFLNLDLDCNSVSLQARRTKSVSIIWSRIMQTMYGVIPVTIAVLICFFVRRHKKKKKPIEVVCSESFRNQDATECLIEEEAIDL